MMLQSRAATARDERPGFRRRRAPRLAALPPAREPYDHHRVESLPLRFPGLSFLLSLPPLPLPHDRIRLGPDPGPATDWPLSLSPASGSVSPRLRPLDSDKIALHHRRRRRRRRIPHTRRRGAKAPFAPSRM